MKEAEEEIQLTDNALEWEHLRKKKAVKEAGVFYKKTVNSTLHVLTIAEERNT